MFSKSVGRWLDASGPDSDIVLSTRIRLARNLAGLAFPGQAPAAEQDQVIQRTELALQKLSVYAPDRFIARSNLTPLKTSYLVERHLVSPDFALPARGSAQHRAVFVGPDETLSVMVNEEDHLRLQILASGFDLSPALAELQSFDAALGAELGYAYSETLGFLTACPTNVGTGMRASVMIHLPGLVLTREIERILRGALQVGLAVRGLFGEGTETKGNLFQISNQVALGKSEEEIVEELAKTTREVIGFERKARDYLLAHLRPEIEDKVFRAEAVLHSARLLNSSEVTNFLGLLRLGVATGLLAKPDLRLINELLILGRPANLQVYYDQELSEAERDARRAELVRARLLTA
jgi:protein arginine kinase